MMNKYDMNIIKNKNNTIAALTAERDALQQQLDYCNGGDQGDWMLKSAAESVMRQNEARERLLRKLAHDIEADAATMLHAINITLSVAFDPACVQASVEIQKAADALASGKEINSKKILIHKHTDECLEYAAKTGKAICIVECRDSYKELIK